MDFLIYSLLFLTLAGIADVVRPRLSSGARVLWGLVLVFLPVVGLVAWVLTRHTAHRELEPPPPTPLEPVPAATE